MKEIIIDSLFCFVETIIILYFIESVFHKTGVKSFTSTVHGNSIYFCGVTEVGSKRISRKRVGSRAALNINRFLLIRLY